DDLATRHFVALDEEVAGEDLEAAVMASGDLGTGESDARAIGESIAGSGGGGGFRLDGFLDGRVGGLVGGILAGSEDEGGKAHGGNGGFHHWLCWLRGKEAGYSKSKRSASTASSPARSSSGPAVSAERA